MINISAIILCKNASNSLERTLKSLEFCDEIILADDGSTDNSTEIAKKFGAKILHLPPGLGFAAKRNFAMQHATHEWVLFVDSDEVVSDQLVQSIEKSIGSELNGYLIRRTDIFMGRKLLHGEVGNVWLLRLAKKSAGKWIRNVHEIWQITGGIGKLDGALQHYPHQTVSEFISDITMYAELESKNRQQTQVITFVQLILFPPAKFVHNYFLRLGFLDGVPGLIYAWAMSLHSLCVRIFILEKYEA